MNFLRRFLGSKPAPASPTPAPASADLAPVAPAPSTPPAPAPEPWRAHLHHARARLEARDLPAALALYANALACSPRPVPTDLLHQVSGDLGNHAHLPELLQLTAPHFDLALHGLPVAHNLLKAHLDLGQLDAARTLLDRLQARQNPEWNQPLAFWEAELARIRQSTRDTPAPGAKIETTLLALEGPVWLPGDSPAAELYPAKSADAPVIAFLGGSADLGPSSDPARRPVAQAAACLSRALPLYLADHVEFTTAAATRTLVSWVVKPNPGFILGGKNWDDATAAHHARRSPADLPADYLVVTHLVCRADPWIIELRLVRTIDAACLATLSAPCSPADPAAALPALAGELLGRLAAQADLPAQPSDFSPPTSSAYLVRLEQLLAIRIAAHSPDPSFLHGERETLDGQLQLCAGQPASLPLRLLLVHTLLGLRHLRPALIPEFRDRILELQTDHPLPEPAHSVITRLLDDLFAA